MQAFFEKYAKDADVMEKLRSLKSGALFSDADEFYDDESEYDDEEDDFMHALVNTLSKAFNNEEKQEVVEQKLVKPITPALKMSRENVGATVDALPSGNGLVQVVAEPGSGKTTVFPGLLKKSTDKDVCVVTHSNAALASAVVNHDVAWIDQKMDFHLKDHGPVYVACETFDEIHMRDARVLDQTEPVGSTIQKDVVLVFDEAQLGGDWGARVNGYTAKYIKTNQVIQLHGNYTDVVPKVPDRITIHTTSVGDIEKSQRILHLHRSESNALRAHNFYKGPKKSFAVTEGDIEGYVSVLKACSLLDEFIIHATPSAVVGLDIPNLDCVVGVNAYVQGETIHTLDYLDHLQCMQRAGRRGQAAKYYISGGKLPRATKQVIQHKATSDTEKFFSALTKVKFKATEFRLGRVKRVRARQIGKELAVVSQSPPKYNQVAGNNTGFDRVKVSNVKQTREDALNASDAILIETMRVNKERISRRVDEFTQLIAGDVPLDIIELSILPVTRNTDTGRYYTIDTIRRLVERGHDATSEVVYNLDYIVHSARKCVVENPNDLRFKTRRTPFFYNLYLDMFDLIAAQTDRCYRIAARDFVREYSDGQRGVFQPQALYLGKCVSIK